ncbi:MAG: hypothetical protein AAGH19_10440 [Pseudomonadota bacterium]
MRTNTTQFMWITKAAVFGTILLTNRFSLGALTVPGTLQMVLCIVVGGALGGLAQALRSDHRFSLEMPGRGGRSWNTGVFGHLFIGSLAAVVVSGFLASDGGLMTWGFFQEDLLVLP